MRTILPIGIFKQFAKRKVKKNSGLTFIEAMVTVAILSFGLVSIYKAFFISLDSIEYISHRLYANSLLDNKIATMERIFEEKKEIPLGLNKEQTRVIFDHKPIDFIYSMNLRNVGKLKGIYQLEVILSWRERQRDVQISRTTYIARIN